MSEAHVLIEIEDGVGTLTLNRPDKLNAFIGEMRSEIAGGIEALGADDGVRAVIITGTGRAFCAGADVKYLTHLIETRAVDEAVALVEAGRRVAGAIRGMPKPVIAAVNGPAAGGGANLALACDLRIASETASIGQTFNRIGLHPDWGGTYAVPRLVGPARAAELFFFAEMVPAAECERMGLVNRVVPPEELMPLAREWARTLARKPALPLRLAKEAVRRSLSSSFGEMMDYETAAQKACFESADALEGVRAFVEKRTPRFGSGGEGGGEAENPGTTEAGERV
ncbi:enoyl-CoA hydratase [Candidatus Palauibacter soopunensis]|uniref:enoyl-CoA hydratase/isomerase family protein n=1 Tax=Candidatus Palauibacter soopunensis TaxID=3056739 RepID=UPI002392A51F|nr:enoyl-CoA hydratase [Candidatus Palauibacter soopunensis]MDE2877284.1 enoyl-CoA hydratase [Candidatus Palauibacter soopunensis]